MLETIEPHDEALAARVAGGDIGAFATLYDRYADRVYAWAAHLLGSGEADDVVQEVFFRMWDKAAQFDPARGRFGAWFGAIARHEILGRGRRRGREQRIVAAEEIDELLARTADPRRRSRRVLRPPSGTPRSPRLCATSQPSSVASSCSRTSAGSRSPRSRPRSRSHSAR